MLGRVRAVLYWLRPKEHFDHPFWEIGVFIAVGAALSLGATVGVAWGAGFETVWARLSDVELLWIPIALAGKVAFDVVNAAKLSIDQWTRHRAFCFWCLIAAAATFATAPLVIPEAFAAITSSRRVAPEGPPRSRT